MYRTYGYYPYPGTNHVGEYISYAEDFYAGLSLQYRYDPIREKLWEKDSRTPEFVYSASGNNLDQGLFSKIQTQELWVEEAYIFDKEKVSRSNEYAIPIIESIFFDDEIELNAVNLPNHGAIKGLPDDMVVETQAIVNGRGITLKPMTVELPTAIIGTIHIQAGIGGKDYNAVDMSWREFYAYYGKPYEIALQEKPKFVMSSFNTFNGVPVSANWGAVTELQNHRVAGNGKEAAELALKAGIDIEMVSTLYLEHFEQILEENPGLLQDIDTAVLKILQLKNEMGLFENPYVDEAREDEVILNPCFLEHTKDAAKRSCVLLKNEQMLPIRKEYKKIIIVGPFAGSNQLLGNWPCKGSFDDVVTLAEGLKQVDDSFDLQVYESLKDCPQAELEQCDYIVVAVGEDWKLSGEGHSSVNIELEASQQQLIREVKQTNKSYACVFFSGRPLALQNIIDDIPALLWCWYPGTQAGSAIAELITGQATPSGKLTMSFPRHSAQAPIYYNEYSTGRPANESSYSSRYQDCEIGPLFPFGHGLTYSGAQYSDFTISRDHVTADQELTISFQVSNPSGYNYSETAILYIEDLVSKAVRPVREMKKYQVVDLPEHQTVRPAANG
ncbi:hypothetical protein G195_000189 [Phytophthora kernoviae 00238/432]|uniref:beta-glucosidase n=1 Tax=Phytophthora kernoviae 00238/432 TaxID=1284355 RepID=A0A8J4WBR6_9STRA|nr:hypothetical protein G195_000189 [Phytophthora kernoviae 00238/432]